MSIRGYPRFTCYRKLSLESLNSIPILYLWLANCLFLYLGFKVNDLGLFVPINLIVNLKSQQKCLFFLLFSEQTAANLLYDSHSFQLTMQIAYGQPLSLPISPIRGVLLLQLIHYPLFTTLTYIITQSPQLTIGLLLVLSILQVWACIYHSITQNIFTAPDMFCTLLTHHPPTCTHTP